MTDSTTAPAAPGKPLRDAATVMLLRDGPDGLEVFMLQRTLNAAFVGGFYVFPGGVVDDADRHADVGAVCEGRTDAEASDVLGIDRGGLAFWVAAIRECFEEAGVLLARTPDHAFVSFDDAGVADRFRVHRAAIDDRSLRIVDLCVSEGLHLDLGEIAYVSHWITPLAEPRRFDTRFFVAHAPAQQTPLHDDRETIASLWVRPADALERQRRGELQLIIPTIKNLEFLLPHATAADALQAAQLAGRPEVIFPKIVRKGDLMSVLLPGDPGYDDAPDVV
jgi:8-oxo-dGTP pyrophosphatase MutT (NUDIX family)